MTVVQLPPIEAGADMSDELERRLRPIALSARAGDITARDALYVAFLPKLERMYGRGRPPRHGDMVGTWDRGDVAQEGWLVFDRLVRSWEPHKPFGRYILANFPWRLRDAVLRGVGRSPAPPRCEVVQEVEIAWFADRRAAHEFTDAELRAFADALTPRQRKVLMCHLGAGESLRSIARDLGLGRRTVTRDWCAVREAYAA